MAFVVPALAGLFRLKAVLRTSQSTRGTEEVFGDGFLAREEFFPKTTSVPFLTW
jgi:hypothetical protein